MKTVIVTGAAGFVGSALVRALLVKDIIVYALDVVDRPKRIDLLNPHLHYFKLEIEKISELESLFMKARPDTFFHLAWIGSAGPLRNDYMTQINNAIQVVKLLEYANYLGCKKFVCAGTIMEYEVTSVMYAQNTSPQLGYIYGVGKQLAHCLCKPIANSLKIDLVWTYITNAYGPGETSPRLLNSTLRKIIKNEDLVFTSATQNYDFIYIDDVANAFFLVGEKGMANCGYLIGSGNAKPLKLFLDEIGEATNSISRFTYGGIPFTGVNLPLEVFSIAKLQEDTGFVPLVSFKEGVLKTQDWLAEEIKNGN